MDTGVFIFVFVVVTATAALQGAAGYGLNVIAAPLLMMVDPGLVQMDAQRARAYYAAVTSGVARVSTSR